MENFPTGSATDTEKCHCHDRNYRYHRNYPIEDLIEDQTNYQHTQNCWEEKDTSEERFEPDIAVENQCQNQTDPNNKDHSQNREFNIEQYCILESFVSKCFNIIGKPNKLKIFCQSIPVCKTVHDSDRNRVNKKYAVQYGSWNGK